MHFVVRLYTALQVRREIVSQQTPGGLQTGEFRMRIGSAGVAHGLVGSCALLGEPINVPFGMLRSVALLCLNSFFLSHDEIKVIVPRVYDFVRSRQRGSLCQGD